MPLPVTLSFWPLIFAKTDDFGLAEACSAPPPSATAASTARAHLFLIYSSSLRLRATCVARAGRERTIPPPTGVNRIGAESADQERSALSRRWSTPPPRSS